MFAEGNNKDVVFADINLSEAPIRGAPHNPGESFSCALLAAYHALFVMAYVSRYSLRWACLSLLMSISIFTSRTFVTVSNASSPSGSGGWPTIRFFTKETGLEGGNYVKKTTKSVCDELGNEMNMIDYVENYAKTFICSVDSADSCSEKEQAYIQKMMSAGAEEQQAQEERLKAVTSTKGQKVDLHEWALRRLRILKQLLASSSGSAGDEL
jgi:hypothetical protein